MGTDTIGAFAFWLAIGALGVGLFFGPIGQALARRLDGRPRDDGRLRDLEERMGTLEQAQTRMAELEERLDFAERLLTQQRESSRLGQGQG